MKKLNELVECSFDIEIFGVVDDSRLVKPGFLFVTTRGFNVDHYDYIDDAINNGAVAIVSDREVDVNIPVVIVQNINSAFVKICQMFYDVDPSEFKLIGITGTDGKTTTASIVRQILLPDINIAYIGTNGVDVKDVHFSTNNTTPCISELYECLSKIKEYDCKTVVMEVSSEALLHNRVDGLKFDIIAFTNITEDHLNIHGNIENYRNSKFLLVNYLKDDGVIFLNKDDDNCQMLTDDRVVTYGFNIDGYFTIYDVKCKSKNVEFDVKNSKLNIVDKIISPLLGQYNVYNVTLAFIIGLQFGISSEVLIDRIRSLKTISGRREMLDFGQDFDIILDYAHTYNGISNVLDSVKHFDNVITVTGAAGGREKEKRSKIGKLILEKCDYAIFTMDDPRYESVDSIIDDMLSNTCLKNYERIVDREEAIFRALSYAKEGTVVLILGKGRDNYMAIEDKKIAYSDYDVVAKYFNK